MSTITIAVPTYQRSDGLLRLCGHLLPQAATQASPDDPIEILVADNDSHPSAKPTLTTWLSRVDMPAHVSVRYVHEPRPGIAAVRNRLLEETSGRDLVIFVDDDEVPTDGWLRALLSAWRQGDADLVAGPVRPVYPSGVPDWIRQGPFHDAPHLENGTVMDHAGAGNLLLDRAVVDRLNVRFPDLGTRGGEDSRFTKALTDKGAVLRWCADAVIEEPVPARRTSPRWVITRSIGNGLSWGELLRTREDGPGRPLGLARRGYISALGLTRVAAGVGTVGLGLMRRSPATFGWGVHRVGRGAGMIGGAWDVVYDEYARPGTHRWRRERASS